MPSAFRRSLTIAWAITLIASTPIFAETPATPRLRSETAEGREIIGALLDRSITARALLDRLEHSDVIVYVRLRRFTTTTIEGRIGLLSATPGARFLVVELSCGRSELDTLVTLGHELRHAVEIAEAPSIVSLRTLSAHYQQIGIRDNPSSSAETFETRAASDAARRVRHDLMKREAF